MLQKDFLKYYPHKYAYFLKCHQDKKPDLTRSTSLLLKKTLPGYHIHRTYLYNYNKSDYGFESSFLLVFDSYIYAISMKLCIDLRLHSTFKKGVSLSSMLNAIKKYATLCRIIHYNSMKQKYVMEENITILFVIFVQIFVRRNGKVGLFITSDCIKDQISVWLYIIRRPETNKIQSRSTYRQLEGGGKMKLESKAMEQII